MRGILPTLSHFILSKAMLGNYYPSFNTGGNGDPEATSTQDTWQGRILGEPGGHEALSASHQRCFSACILPASSAPRAMSFQSQILQTWFPGGPRLAYVPYLVAIERRVTDTI